MIYKEFFLSLIVLCLSFSITAQTENEQIKVTINNYIEGTSYNQLDQIAEAFYPEAELFLDINDEMVVVPISEYISWFENNKPGEFNGRVGRIISIDQFQNVATAKAEILMPKSKSRFIDFFILKKIEGKWKIISKTASKKESNKTGDRILFVASNATFYGNSDIATGNSFSEIVNAYHVLDQAGYTIDFVSPIGGTVPLAYINTSEEQEKSYLYDKDFMYALEYTLSPEQVDPNLYRAIYYVGGGSAMFGVPENEAIQKIAMKIYEENNGIISSVCHGTAGIVNLKTKEGNYLVEGKAVNGYPDSYENQDADYFQQFPFLIQKTIEDRGGNFKFSERRTPHVEVTGRLITGQNHLSSTLVADKIIETLEQIQKQ